MKYLKNFENFDSISDKLNNEYKIDIQISKYGDMAVEIYKKDRKIGTIDLDSKDSINYCIVDSRINKPYRGKGLYKNALIKILNTYPNIKIYSILRTESAEYAWESFNNISDIICEKVNINSTPFSNSAWELYHSSPKNLYEEPKIAYVLYKK